MIADYTITESNNNNMTQASQIEDMVLKYDSAIIVDPGSPTALNGAIAKAQAANIPVIVVNDGPVTSTYPYELLINDQDIAVKMAQWTINKLNGKGNILMVRGIAGSECDTSLYNAELNVVKKYPGIKIVGQVYGQWTESIAQSTVTSILPSMPRIDGVINQGGDFYGTVQAFQTSGRPIPVMCAGVRGDEIHWWINEVKKDPKYSDYAINGDPSDAAMCLYVALDILNGKKVPQNMVVPSVVVTDSTLSQYANLPDDRVASSTIDADWVRNNLENQQSASLAPWLNP